VRQGVYTFDSSTLGFFILHPSVLVSATVLSGSFECMRRSILDERIKSPSEMSIPMLRGSLIHELVQTVLSSGTSTQLVELIDQLVKGSIEDLWAAKTSEAEMTEELLSTIPRIQEWEETFLTKSMGVS
jgi:DNA replication ATP-dependent helicase Dna2